MHGRQGLVLPLVHNHKQANKHPCTVAHLLAPFARPCLPQVSGAAALVLSLSQQQLTTAQLKQLLLDSSDLIPGLSGKIGGTATAVGS